ncbi:MAG TPA: pyridoxal phosphate-dependent aminotransferase family protein [Longimicrobiales bacterium]|nr:pyridoxal phosphate-dependent aminotransferase family protein [Longimicrobiales bacterium]
MTPTGDGAIREYTSTPFQKMFTSFGVDELIEEGTLLDCPGARRWFERFEVGLVDDIYTYQLPLDQMAGPDSVALGQPIVMFSTYSYLGLIGHPRIQNAVKAAIDRYGTSTGGVRLLTGTLRLHLELERELAAFLGQEAAAVYPSGYDANVAAITSLFGSEDIALLDQYAHASIVEGVRTSGAEMRRFRHNDMEDLERRLRQARNRGYKRILIAVDGVFSMDGDQAPMAELIRLKQEYGVFLLVDEAHSLGAVGQTGRGVCEAQGVDPRDVDIHTGSLSKGIPSSGGFAAGSELLKIYLQHGSNPYIFSAALTPANAAACLEAFRMLDEEDEHMERLRENTRRLDEGLTRLGLNPGTAESPVIPVMLGQDRRAFLWSKWLLEDFGVFTSAVVFPAVSPGQARLRICATAAHGPEHFERLFEGLAACLEREKSAHE